MWEQVPSSVLVLVVAAFILNYLLALTISGLLRSHYVHPENFSH